MEICRERFQIKGPFPLHSRLVLSQGQLGWGCVHTAAFTSMIWTRLKSEVWCHHCAKRIICLPCSQMTENMQWNASNTQPYSRAKPSTACIPPGTAKCKRNIPHATHAQQRNDHWWKPPQRGLKRGVASHHGGLSSEVPLNLKKQTQCSWQMPRLITKCSIFLATVFYRGIVFRYYGLNEWK